MHVQFYSGYSRANPFLFGRPKPNQNTQVACRPTFSAEPLSEEVVGFLKWAKSLPKSDGTWNMIGRSSGSGYMLSGAPVSKEHGALKHRLDDSFDYIDLHSTNGTKINGNRIPASSKSLTEYSVKQKDVLKIGTHTIPFDFSLIPPEPLDDRTYVNQPGEFE